MRVNPFFLQSFYTEFVLRHLVASTFKEHIMKKADSVSINELNFQEVAEDTARISIVSALVAGLIYCIALLV